LAVKGAKPALKLVGDADLGARSMPRVPSWLPEPGKAEWRRVLPLLLERGILSRADLSTVASYCAAFGTVQQCQEILNREGLVVEGAQGSKGHPASQIQHRAQSQMRQYAAELGLTPVSRSRAAVVDRRESDDWSDLDI
jgi:P27 family predicted phage terminase small subunit